MFIEYTKFAKKSSHKFSLIGKDPSHEQSNKSLQTHGGAVVLYEIPETRTLFMLASPDCVKEFEVVLDTPRSSTAHNDEAHSLQVKYRKDALSFVETVEQFRNPFGPGHELVALDIHVVMEKEVIISLSRVHQRGEELHPSCTIRTFHRQSIK